MIFEAFMSIFESKNADKLLKMFMIAYGIDHPDKRPEYCGIKK